MILLELLSAYIFTGVTGNTAYAVAKKFWQKAFGKSVEFLYLDAFAQAVDIERPRLQKHGEQVSLNREQLSKALHQDLVLSIAPSSSAMLNDNDFVARLADAFYERQVVEIGGHGLDRDSYTQLVRKLIVQTKGLFRQRVLDNEQVFKQVLLAEVEGNNQRLGELSIYLNTNFDLLSDKLELISTDLAEIKQNIAQLLEMNRSRESIVHELRQSVHVTERGSMFDAGGWCSGYQFQPLPERFFLAQPFTPERIDLRNALGDALAEFSVQPITADNMLWQGYLICKISALIHSTPFGVYQLTISQNRNVHLELGIAIGLGRPFVLIKDADAEIAQLLRGLDYYPIESYLELKYGLGSMVRPFITSLANYKPPALASAGLQPTAIIAHGELEPVDFTVAIARFASKFNLTPVIIGNSTNRIADIMKREGLSYHAIGAIGPTVLNETVSAIQAARLGFYRVDKESSADAFAALGIALGLNRPAILCCRSKSEEISDLKGVITQKFNGFTELEKMLNEQFGNFLKRFV